MYFVSITIMGIQYSVPKVECITMDKNKLGK